jgi:hypothetical protein
MLRYVYLGDQITDDSEEFAFYDTITDTFLSFDGQQTFDSIEDFSFWAKDSDIYERCLGLIGPEKYESWTVEALEKFFEDETTWFDNKCHSMAVALVGKNSHGLLTRLIKASPDDYIQNEED